MQAPRAICGCIEMGDEAMTLGWILLAILAVLFVVSLPFWPHSRDWGGAAPLSFGILLLIAVLMKMSGTLDPMLRSVLSVLGQ